MIDIHILWLCCLLVYSQWLYQHTVNLNLTVIPELTDAATVQHMQYPNNCHYCEAVKLTNCFEESF